MVCRQTDRTERNAGPRRILIVDDDAGIRIVLEEALRHLGYEVQGALDGLWVSRALQQDVFPFDVVILDWKMPELDGLAVLQELRTRAPETPVLFISIAVDDQLRREALSLGAFEVLRKPFDLHTLALLVKSALRQGQRGGTHRGPANRQQRGGECR
jgi:two-component system, OmpR family, response regulator